LWGLVLYFLNMKNKQTRQPEKRSKQKSKWTKLNSWLHLWLGLSSGIIVFIVAITGVLFIFCDDIIDGLAYNSLYVQEVKEQKLTPEEILKAFKQQRPDRKASYFVTYRDPKRTIKIASSTKERELQFSWVDPYTGKVLSSDGAYDVFYIIAHIHSGEMPFGETGHLIVEISVWIFLIELITGLILWWPKKWTKASRQQNFTIKTKASFKRLNYDLHNVPGFYSLLPALMITITGLIVVNKTLNNATQKVLGGTPEAYSTMRDIKAEYDANKKFAPLTPVINQLFAIDPSFRQVRMSIAPKDSITSYYAIAAEEIGLKGIQNGRVFAINRYTGKEIKLSVSLTKGIKIDDMTMNLHIGFWAGWYGKILNFIVGIICAALPITGFIIWRGRLKKKKVANSN
jgi:uncharacterized iron-regulated membrane protein